MNDFDHSAVNPPVRAVTSDSSGYINLAPRAKPRTLALSHVNRNLDPVCSSRAAPTCDLPNHRCFCVIWNDRQISFIGGCKIKALIPFSVDESTVV